MNPPAETLEPEVPVAAGDDGGRVDDPGDGHAGDGAGGDGGSGLDDGLALDTDGAAAPPYGLSVGRIVALVLAFAFLAGAAGYFLADRTSGPPDSAVDTGFLQDMIDHHDQAVTMASLANANASDATVRDFAREVLIEQRYEIGLMDAYLQARDKGRGAEDREVMAWMGRPLPIAEMPGLATPDQLRQLRNADPDETNILFLRLMIAHHQGGIDMAEYASRHAKDPKIRHLASVMANVQRQEVREYQLKLQDLTGE
jgi:uncharacterized protein (DUF305 family)